MWCSEQSVRVVKQVVHDSCSLCLNTAKRIPRIIDDSRGDMQHDIFTEPDTLPHNFTFHSFWFLNRSFLLEVVVTPLFSVHLWISCVLMTSDWSFIGSTSLGGDGISSASSLYYCCRRYE